MDRLQHIRIPGAAARRVRLLSVEEGIALLVARCGGSGACDHSEWAYDEEPEGEEVWAVRTCEHCGACFREPVEPPWEH